MRVHNLRKPIVCTTNPHLLRFRSARKHPNSLLPERFRTRGSFLSQRAHVYARVRRFSFFAFTSSPFGRKVLVQKGLSVKVKPALPSPVKC